MYTRSGQLFIFFSIPNSIIHWIILTVPPPFKTAKLFVWILWIISEFSDWINAKRLLPDVVRGGLLFATAGMLHWYAAWVLFGQLEVLLLVYSRPVTFWISNSRNMWTASTAVCPDFQTIYTPYGTYLIDWFSHLTLLLKTERIPTWYKIK